MLEYKRETTTGAFRICSSVDNFPLTAKESQLMRYLVMFESRQNFVDQAPLFAVDEGCSIRHGFVLKQLQITRK